MANNNCSGRSCWFQKTLLGEFLNPDPNPDPKANSNADPNPYPKSNPNLDPSPNNRGGFFGGEPSREEFSRGEFSRHLQKHLLKQILQSLPTLIRKKHIVLETIKNTNTKDKTVRFKNMFA